jgi:short-subunit dehydrogenase
MTHPRSLERAYGSCPRALVTGASSGIGAAFARLLAREGYDLTLVARRREHLEQLAESIQKRHVAAVEVLPADLTQEADLGLVEQRLREDPELELLVNNAGRASIGPFAEIDPARHDSDVRLNVLALTRLARAALPGMIRRDQGFIINVSSMAAFAPGPYEAAYFATKAYVNSLTEALRDELRGSGVRVQALCPGFTRTEFMDAAGIDARRVAASMWLEPEQVAETSLTAIREGKLICVPGRMNRVAAALTRILPRRLTSRVIGWQTRRLMP